MNVPMFLPFCLFVDENPQQHVPLQEYSENLKEISRLLTSAGVSADKVIFVTPPPIHEPAWEKECALKGNTEPPFSSVLTFLVVLPAKCLPVSPPGCPLNRHNSMAGQYALACVQAAGQCGSEVLDLWTLMQKDGQVGGVYHYIITSLSCKSFTLNHYTPCIQVSEKRKKNSF